MQLRSTTVAAACALMICAPSPGSAQSLDDLTKAREHFEQGRVYHAQERYENAIEEFKRAYALSKRSALLFNIGQSYRLAGKKKLARDAYLRYLTTQDATFRTVARSHVAALTRALEIERLEAERRDQARAEERARQRRAREAETARHMQRVEAAARSRRTMRFAGLITIGAGVAGLAVGAKYGLDARGFANDIRTNTETEPWPEDILDKFDRGESAERKMLIIGGIGAGTVVAGTVLYWLGTRPRAVERARTQVVPVVQSTAIAVAITHRF